MLAGRDLKASGTWLGLARDGRFGIVTNFRDFDPPPAGAPSRGELVPRYLRGAESAAQYLAELERRAPSYGGFNLLLGGRESLHYFSNRGDAPPRSLAAGVYGLSNQWLDTPWPKLTRTRARFTELLCPAARPPPRNSSRCSRTERRLRMRIAAHRPARGL